MLISKLGRKINIFRLRASLHKAVLLCKLYKLM